MLADGNRADRFLALTGITPDELRSRLGEVTVLVALFDFLLGHEPDLVACADALGVVPESFAAARLALAGPEWEP